MTESTPGAGSADAVVPIVSSMKKPAADVEAPPPPGQVVSTAPSHTPQACTPPLSPLLSLTDARSPYDSTAGSFLMAPPLGSNYDGEDASSEAVRRFLEELGRHHGRLLLPLTSCGEEPPDEDAELSSCY